MHVSVYARPASEAPYTGQPVDGNGYAWIQGNLQYTVESRTTDQASGPDSTELHFDAGGGQVNGFSWVLGAANIQNGSRFFVENAGRAELDARGEFFHDVEEHALYVNAFGQHSLRLDRVAFGFPPPSLLASGCTACPG